MAAQLAPIIMADVTTVPNVVYRIAFASLAVVDVAVVDLAVVIVAVVVAVRNMALDVAHMALEDS